MTPAPEHNRLSAFNGTLRTDSAPKARPAKTSWWIQPTREDFVNEQHDQQKRMTGSSESAKLAIRSLDPR